MVLAQTISEAENFHNFPSAKWRPRKAGGENRCHNLSSQAESKFNLLPPFSSIQAFNRMGDAHLHWGGPSVYYVH